MRAESERIARDWRLATERRRRRGGGGASLLEAARAAEGMLRTQSEKATKLEKLAEENAAGEIRVAGAAGVRRVATGETRAGLGRGGGGGVRERVREPRAEGENFRRAGEAENDGDVAGDRMGPSTDGDDFLDDLASSAATGADGVRDEPARAVAAGIKKRVEALRAEEEARDRERGGVPAGKSHHHSTRARRAGENLADTL